MSDKISHETTEQIVVLYQTLVHLKKMINDVQELKNLIGSIPCNTPEATEIVQQWYLAFGMQRFGVEERLLEVKEDMCKIWNQQSEYKF